MTAIATISLKGGVGKTTLAINLAYTMAQRGWNVLVVDGDPQGSVSASLSRQGSARPGLYEVICQNLPISSAVVQTRVNRFSLLVAGTPPPDQWVAWNRKLEEAATWRQLADSTQSYDLVFIDAPSGLHGPTLGILAAVPYALVPLQVEPLSLRSLPGLLTTFGQLRETGANFQLLGLVPTMVAQDLPEAMETFQQLKQELPPGLLTETFLPRDPIFFQASNFGIPIGLFEPQPPLAQSFEQLAAELEARLGLTTRPVRNNYGPLLE